jgi:hypothetical protein
LTLSSSTIIEHIKGYCDPEPTFAVAYFYFDFNDTEKQSPTSCVSSWIAQLCSQVEKLPQKLKDSYKTYGHQEASLHHLKEILAQFAVTEELHDIFIVADALDECPRNREGNLRAELLELITEINSWSPSNIHLLITSRPEQDIKEILTSLPTTRMISLHGSQVASDIKLHISSQLSTDPKLRTWPREEKAHIEKVLTMGANGM